MSLQSSKGLSRLIESRLRKMNVDFANCVDGLDAVDAENLISIAATEKNPTAG